MPRFVLVSLGLIGMLGTQTMAQVIVTYDPPPSSVTELPQLVGLPDVDQDGADDLILAGPTDTGADVVGAGVVYCYSGRTGVLLYSVTSPTPAWLTYFGQYVAGIQDLDNDGAGDFVVGTLFESAVYVFSGASGTLLRTVSAPRPDCQFGDAVISVPDVNSDGIEDFAIGTKCESVYGTIRLYSGATGAYLRSLISPNDGRGTRYFGEYMAGMPDADGDGAGDIVVGDPYMWRNGQLSDPGGAAYVFSGATGQLIHSLLTPAGPTDYYFGEQVSGIPDVDGDRRGDFMVSGSTHDTAFHSGGRVYLYSGATGGLIRTLDSPNDQSSGRFGYGMVGVRDVDGDARGDLLIGAWGETPQGLPLRAGRAYLISGATGALLRTFVSPMPNRNHANFGTFLATVGDPVMRGATSFAFSSGDCIPPCNHFDLHIGRVYNFRFCRADWNYDGRVDSRDFFAFLIAFFDGRGDYNQDAATDSRDFFDFIADFLGGCDS